MGLLDANTEFRKAMDREMEKIIRTVGHPIDGERMVIELPPGKAGQRLCELIEREIQDFGNGKPCADRVYSPHLIELMRRRPQMFNLLEKMAAIQCRKQDGYANETEPYANYRTAGDFQGTPAYVYVWARAAEKMHRLAELVERRGAEAADEGSLETVLDICNCLLIGEVLHHSPDAQGEVTE